MVHLKNSRDKEAREELGGFLRDLDEIRQHYEATLRDNGIGLPYGPRTRAPNSESGEVLRHG